MKTLVTFEIEHGQSLDGVNAFIALAENLDDYSETGSGEEFKILDYSVQVVESIEDILELLNPVGWEGV